MYGESTFSHYDVLLWLTGLKNTLLMFGFSSLLGCFFGTIFGLIRYYQVAILAPIVFTVGEVLKNSPVIVQLFLVYFGVPMYFEIILTPFEAAAIVLSANTTAFIAVICVSALEAVDKGQVATARTFAMKETDILINVLFPQALVVAAPMVVGILVNQIQVTSLISVIGVIDLTQFGHILNQRTFEPFIVWPVVGLTYFVLSSTISYMGTRVEKKFRIPE
jgi:His/Glu/Gln/Arg/opine family amino acid ABC transporter permease subunit